MTQFQKEYLRSIPKTDQILESKEAQNLLHTYPRYLVVESLREVLRQTREEILACQSKTEVSRIDLKLSKLVEATKKILEELFAPTLNRVINATGIIIHTNLGRSILSSGAWAAAREVATGYSNLEFNLKEGKRGSRHSHVERILRLLTGAEAAMVVNNNAGAVLLALRTLAEGKETVVSRGQLVEIGGSFRIPDIMRQSGSILREVGTTNKTYLSDYESAIGKKTGLLLRVHPSNFKMVGFTAEVSLEELVELGKEHKVPVMEDLGSGVLVNLSEKGLPFEPTAQASVRAGADVVTFSGDKLLGGPQVGIIVGRRRCVNPMKKHPLARALRIDKLCLAALETTLREYLNPEKIFKQNPTLRMMTLSQEELASRADKLAQGLRQKTKGKFKISCEKEISRAGGGALPAAELPTMIVAAGSPNYSAQEIERELRANNPPIIARIKGERILLDPRTIQPRETKEIVAAFRRLV